MIHDHFEQLALMTQLLTFQILSMFPYKEMTFRISTATEIPKEHVMESLYKLKMRDSVQLQTNRSSNAKLSKD